MKKLGFIAIVAGITLLFFIFMTNVVRAENSNLSDEKIKERLEFQKELEKAKKEKPKEYKALQQTFTIMAQFLLGQLGYGLEFNGILDDKTKERVREYQKKNGLPATGDPANFETFDKIEEDLEFLENVPRALPMLHIFTDSWDDGYFSASGTWVYEGQYLPQQTSNIKCRRELGICIDSTAYYGGSGINLDTEIFYIERWNKSEIITKPADAACTRYVIRINRVQKSVTAIRSTISNERYCKKVDKEEIHMTLKDGFEIYSNAVDKYVYKKKSMFKTDPSLLNIFEEKPTQGKINK
jgi:peptidoglycan hydrolase-like protein with peptidoglycan-binding domain